MRKALSLPLSWPLSGPLAAITLALGLAFAPSALAGDPCTVEGIAVPGCVQVTSPVIDLKPRLGSAIINVFCPSSASYYWGGYSANHNRWVTVVDLSLFASGANHGKFEGTNFNSEFRHSFSVTIGCSRYPPWAANCQGSGSFCPRDPGCRITRGATSRCAGPPDAPQCWIEWEEDCGTPPNDTPYFCNTLLFKPCCYPCAGGG